MRYFRLVVSLLVAAVFAIAAGVPIGVAGVPSDRRPTPPPIGVPPPSLRPPIVVLSVGDSLSVGHGPGGTITQSYRMELSRLMNMSGQPHTWRVEAVGGKKCSYFADRIDLIITSHNPNLIFLNCGTNDEPPIDNTEAAYRTILTRAAARNVPVIASSIVYPDMRSPTNIVRPYIEGWHRSTNLAIGRALAAFPNVAYADLTRIPADLEWLQTDGIHWLARAEAGVAELFYRAAQPSRGWLTLQQMGQRGMCGLSGSWPGDPRRIPDVDYIVCRS